MIPSCTNSKFITPRILRQLFPILSRKSSSLVSPRPPQNFPISTKKIFDEEVTNSLKASEHELLSSLGPLGQPSFLTHPHMVAPGQITTGIYRQEYAERRKRLMLDIPDGSVVFVGSYGVRYMTNGIFYPFHQNTDLLYLSGCLEPHCALVMVKQGQEYTSHFFLRPKDKRVEMWDGPRLGLEGAKTFLGMDQAHSIDHLGSFLQSLVDEGIDMNIYTNVPISLDTEKPNLWKRKSTTSGYSQTDPSKADKEASLSNFVKNVNLTSTSHVNVRPIKPLIQELRLVKSEAEARLLRRAGEIAGKGFREMMSKSPKSLTEHQLHAYFELFTRIEGANHQAYVPVVASGKNALILHYVSNSALLSPGDLVLVDAGVTYGGYVSDITRTWPVNGKFTPHQRGLYKVVLQAQLKVIESATEDAQVTLDDLHYVSVDSMQKGLGDLFGKTIRRGEMDSLYPHHVGHWMGMDVHDCDGVHRSRKLRSGHVITVEPGLYIPMNSAYPLEFQGMGIRIEDDVLVGKNGNVVLSQDAPKHPDDIEAVCMGQ